MTPEAIDTPRARYFDHFRAEIESVAWTQVSAADADPLSIKAIAAQMGVSAAALYRYIGSRDELLDKLAVKAATELVENVEELVRSVPDCTERVVRIAGYVRAWAQEFPGRFAIVFRTRDGRPRVPPGVADAERRILHLIATACTSAVSSASSDTRPRPRPAPAQAATDNDAATPTAAPTATTDRALGIWTCVLGTVELELTGHLDRLGINVDDYFEAEIRQAVHATRPDRVLLPAEQ